MDLNTILKGVTVKMPNPRYIVKPDFKKWAGEPTVELLEKMALAKETYWKDLVPFCRRNSYDPGMII